jgi:hypothetical protein
MPLQRPDHVVLVRPAATHKFLPNSAGATGHHGAVNHDVELPPTALVEVRVYTETIFSRGSEPRRPFLVASDFAILDAHVHSGSFGLTPS